MIPKISLTPEMSDTVKKLMLDVSSPEERYQFACYLTYLCGLGGNVSDDACRQHIVNGQETAIGSFTDALVNIIIQCGYPPEYLSIPDMTSLREFWAVCIDHADVVCQSRDRFVQYLQLERSAVAGEATTFKALRVAQENLYMEMAKLAQLDDEQWSVLTRLVSASLAYHGQLDPVHYPAGLLQYAFFEIQDHTAQIPASMAEIDELTDEVSKSPRIRGLLLRYELYVGSLQQDAQQYGWKVTGPSAQLLTQLTQLRRTSHIKYLADQEPLALPPGKEQ